MGRDYTNRDMTHYYCPECGAVVEEDATPAHTCPTMFALPSLGSYFGLIDGVLVCAAMNADGTMDESITEVAGFRGMIGDELQEDAQLAAVNALLGTSFTHDSFPGR